MDNSSFENPSDLPPNSDDASNTSSLFPVGDLPTGDDDRSSLITARGTSDGLVIRLDGRVEAKSLKDALDTFVQARRSFLAGNDISLEWVGVKPEEIVVNEISQLLSDRFSIVVRASKLKASMVKTGQQDDAPHAQGKKPFTLVSGTGAAQQTSAAPGPSAGSKNITLSAASPLFGGIPGGIPLMESRSSGSPVSWDEPDARIFFTTLRSGQKLETEYSVVIFGDVNSGAEIIAGGDIVVLGTMRGIAHAGAYDESGGGRVIFCTNFQPTQLRIGTAISRGGSEEKGDGDRGPEIARVENNMIVVESYQSRSVWGRRSNI